MKVGDVISTRDDTRPCRGCSSAVPVKISIRRSWNGADEEHVEPSWPLCAACERWMYAKCTPEKRTAAALAMFREVLACVTCGFERKVLVRRSCDGGARREVYNETCDACVKIASALSHELRRHRARLASEGP